MPPTSRRSTIFHYQGKVDFLLLAIFVLVNGLVLINSILHNPEMGYDADDHLAYMQVLPYRLPYEDDTREFFSPPLPYFLPSLVDKACIALNHGKSEAYLFETCRKAGGKAGQLINFGLSVGLTLLLLQVCELLRPGSRTFKLTALSLVGVMTVYYKTFSQLRGEPYVAFFTFWTLYLVAKILRERQGIAWQRGLLLGLSLGLLALSRQWGFMVFPAVGGLALLVWLRERGQGWPLLRAVLVSFVAAAMVCGWWYLNLLTDYDTLFAFNQDSPGFHFSNQPYGFYRHTELDDMDLFKTPTRRSFDNELIPIFYSEMWGDYWGYFIFIRDKSYLGVLGLANQEQVNPYLGRVNAVSVYPSLILMAGLGIGLFSLFKLWWAQGADRERALYDTFLLMIVGSTYLIYMFFLISFPDLAQGATIKATYVLHGLLVLPILGAEAIERLKLFRPLAYHLAMVLLGLVFLHNLPALITRYRMF